MVSIPSPNTPVFAIEKSDPVIFQLLFLRTVMLLPESAPTEVSPSAKIANAERLEVLLRVSPSLKKLTVVFKGSKPILNGASISEISKPAPVSAKFSVRIS